MLAAILSLVLVAVVVALVGPGNVLWFVAKGWETLEIVGTACELLSAAFHLVCMIFEGLGAVFEFLSLFMVL